MDLVAKDKAEIDFEELLSAAWAAQLAKLHSNSVWGESVDRAGDSVKEQESGK